MNALQVEDLTVEFRQNKRIAKVVRGVSFEIEQGKTLGLVGESGCGKSVTSMAIMRLLETPPAEIGGRVSLDDCQLLELDKKTMRSKRGLDIAMIFQEPMTSLNPVFTIGDQLTEALMVHENVTQEQALSRAIDALTEVGIAGAQSIVERYPHELSGGMKQRAMIAMALICKPGLLIADEPTTALDVTVQAQILDLLRELQENHNMSMLFITHDLGVVAELAHEVCVMYAGRIVERAATDTLFDNPLHPYTQGLLKSIPVIDSHKDKLEPIEGIVPSPSALPEGCKFAPRCPKATDICRQKEPQLESKSDNHLAACHHC